MCRHHGALVDHDHRRYSVRQLRKWKNQAERRAQRELEASGVSRRRQLVTRLQITDRARIVFARRAGSALYASPGGPYLYFVAQLWFQTESASGGAVAKSLTASLAFLHMHTGEPLFNEIRGEWAIANAADNVGFGETREILRNLAPVGEFAKLIVLQKRIEEPIAYAWSRGAPEYPGRRHVSHQIPSGEYQLRVRVRGINIDETFTFRLVNPGQGADPIIEGEPLSPTPPESTPLRG